MFLISISTLLRKYSYLFFLFCLFLVKVPPFFLSPFIHSLLTTYGLFSFLVFTLVILFFTGILEAKKLDGDDRKLLKIFLIFFLFQSLSIVSATDMESYLQIYKNLIFSGLFLFLVIQYKKEYKKIVQILIFASIISLFYQALMFLFPGIYSSFGELIVEGKHFELALLNLGRNRIYVESFDEAIIPLLFLFYFYHKQKTYKQWRLLLIPLIVTASFVSNFRTRILMSVFSIFSTLFILLKTKKISFSFLFVSTFVLIGIGFFVYLIQLNYGFSYLDRVLLINETEDVSPINSRIQNVQRASEIGLANPLFGIGLGNYYTIVPSSQKFNTSLNTDRSRLTNIALGNPHNILAQIYSETGVLSLLFYLGMILYFLKSDYKIIQMNGNNSYRSGFVIAFWTVFIYGFFNPAITLSYHVFFWTFRGLINIHENTN